MAWRRSVPHLHQARYEMQGVIERLEKAAEALRLSMEGNQSAESSPVRQRHLDAIAMRLANAHAEQAQIEQLIEELARDA